MEFYTAPTYEGLEIREPFQENGKWYGYVSLKSNPNKKIRLYDKPQTKADAAVVSQSKKWNARKALGFSTTGYITIFKGKISMDDDWFNKSPCYYHRIWGWYLVDGKEVPTDLPTYAEPKQLYWTAVGNDDNTLKEKKIIQKEVNKLIF